MAGSGSNHTRSSAQERGEEGGGGTGRMARRPAGVARCRAATRQRRAGHSVAPTAAAEAAAATTAAEAATAATAAATTAAEATTAATAAATAAAEAATAPEAAPHAAATRSTTRATTRAATGALGLGKEARHGKHLVGADVDLVALLERACHDAGLAAHREELRQR